MHHGLLLIGLAHEDYPEYYDYLSMAFAKVKQKPRVVEEHDSISGIMSAVEAGTGVAIGGDILGYSFGNRVRLVHITPEPKTVLHRSRRPQRKTQPNRGKILAMREGRAC